MDNALFTGNARMIRLGKIILYFLENESLLLESDEVAHHNSSDIIELLFGTYKSRKSKNKLCGITPFILFVPAYTEYTEIK